MTIFTRERGKLDAVAKGVRRMRSHLAGRLELANECAFLMHRGRTLEVIVSAETISAPWPTLVEPERYAVVSLMAETVDAFCEPDLALPEVYDLLAGGIGTIAACADPLGLLPRVSLRLLDLLGLAPPLDRCVHCGGALASGSAWLDAEAGGFIDEACRERWRDLAELTPKDLVNLRALAVPKGGEAAALHAPPPAQGRRVSRRPRGVIMALDVGSKRIGIAVSDPSATFALPVATIERTNRREDLARIQELVDSYGIAELVVGDPLTLAGDRGIAAREMDAFVEKLREVFPGTIHRVDERLTTAQATKSLIAADVSRQKRWTIVDRMAAALILEAFLARRRNEPIA